MLCSGYPWDPREASTWLVPTVVRAALRVKEAAAAVLDRAADLLDSRGGSSDELDAALAELAAARTDMQENVLTGLPAERAEPASEFITSLDPAFRAEELSYAVSLIARTVGLTAAAERRSWRERWLGRQPEGVPGTLSAARERITSYLEPHSVWLHNSLRGAAGLGLAVLAARLTGVQHSFWVVLGALSVLRSNALNTGQDAVRAMLGTAAGFIAGAALLAGIGTNTTLLWFLLPLAVFLAGVAPAVISFAAGQAARPHSPLWPATRPGPLRHRAGSMTRSARTWPSAVRNGSRSPIWPGWSPGSPDCAWKLTRYGTCGGATTARRAATWPPHAMRSWAPLTASPAGTTLSRPP